MTRETRPLDALLAAGAVLALFFLLGPLLRIPLHLPLGYNEGWNAYLARRAVEPGAGPLYPPAGSLVFDNYPPLSFVVVGALGRWVVGDMIVAGRIVALASLLASAWLLGLCVRRLAPRQAGDGERGGLAAGLLLLLFAATLFRRYVAVDEPQWFGHALALGGLAVLLGGGGEQAASAQPTPVRPTPARLIVAAVLMTASGMVKHLLVGLPLAVTLWLALGHRRSAGTWLAAAVASLAAALALTDLVWGRDAFLDVLGHHRIYRASRVLAAAVRILPPLLPMLVIAAAGARAGGWRRDDPGLRLALLFVAVATVTGLVERTGDGVNYNAHFETLIACCLMTGLAVSRRPSARLAGFAALPLLVLVPLGVGGAVRDVTASRAQAASWQPLVARLRAVPGIAGCETLSLCFWAGRPYAVDMFNLEQDILTGGSGARFDALAAAHAFGGFELGRTQHAAATRRDDVLARDLLRHGYAATSSGPDGSVLLTPPAGGAGEDAGEDAPRGSGAGR